MCNCARVGSGRRSCPSLIACQQQQQQQPAGQQLHQQEPKQQAEHED
jgi:hypothetical protein